MRTLSPALADHLASGTTTLCHCWRVTRGDATALGFTDHDRDLVFDGTRFAAGSGFEASAIDGGSGLSDGAGDIRGGFSSEAITAADIALGLYDGARVEVFRVNWADPSQRLLVKVQVIGDVTRTGEAFTAELRPFTHRLQQAEGRSFTRTCGAIFGDAACRFTPVDGTHRFAGMVAEVVSDSRLRLSAVQPPAGQVLAQGTLSFLDGVLTGKGFQLAGAMSEGAATILDLFLPMPLLPKAGDAVSVTVGCDKSFSTCASRFGNALNFQGFPHMPGPDFAYSYADRDTVHDGSALFS